jgi:hypothetical protein
LNAALVKSDQPHILCVNPWIHDFAAYDFWASPIGLLSLAAILRQHGFRVSFIDCLDRFHPKAAPVSRQRAGRGPYLKQEIAKPAGLQAIPRTYSRYGISPQWFQEDLLALEAPDLILVTSMMTYWYPGLQETIGILKKTFSAPVWLGGIYATLCTDHARATSGADKVLPGAGEIDILDQVAAFTGGGKTIGFDPQNLDTYPYPALDLKRKLAHVPLLTSRGCPFSCRYCASAFLNPRRLRRDPAAVVEEIRYWHTRFGIIDFAFYDDALLVDAEQHVIPMLENIIESRINVRFHTPNALHLRHITAKTAKLMHQAGFETIRLGLETAAFHPGKRLDVKVAAGDFSRAVGHLQSAGFSPGKIGAYLLAGLPDQDTEQLVASIVAVKEMGILPILAYYSPIPHTAVWNQAVKASRYDLASDPVFTNNAIFPCQPENFSWETKSALKRLIAA